MTAISHSYELYDTKFEKSSVAKWWTFIFQEIPLGRWEFRSKSSKDSSSQEGWCRGYMFSLEVTQELETWPEQKDHNRHWVSVLYKFLKQIHHI